VKQKVKYEEVRNIRKKKGYSVEYMVQELAKRQIKMKETNYYKKEAGTVPTTINEAKNIANILNKSPLIFFKE